MKFLSSLLCAATIFPSVAQAEFRIRDYYIECEGHLQNSNWRSVVTLKLNNVFRTIGHVSPEVTELEILEWQSEFIKAVTTMSFEVATNLPIRTDLQTNETEFSLNRMDGSLAVVGLQAPSEEQVEECRDGNDNTFCGARLVVERANYICREVEPRF